MASGLIIILFLILESRGLDSQMGNDQGILTNYGLSRVKNKKCKEVLVKGKVLYRVAD